MKTRIFSAITACLLTVYNHAQTANDSVTFAERKAKVIEILQKNVDNGLPGVAVSFYSAKEGNWAHSEGYSNIERKVPLKNSDLHYLQSVTKTYMAVAILKLMEEKQLDLNDDISKYLGAGSIGSLAKKGITVKMLLNHTSGIQDYATNPEFMAFVMSDVIQTFHGS